MITSNISSIAAYDVAIINPTRLTMSYVGPHTSYEGS